MLKLHGQRQFQSAKLLDNLYMESKAAETRLCRQDFKAVCEHFNVSRPIIADLLGAYGCDFVSGYIMLASASSVAASTWFLAMESDDFKLSFEELASLMGVASRQNSQARVHAAFRKQDDARLLERTATLPTLCIQGDSDRLVLVDAHEQYMKTHLKTLEYLPPIGRRRPLSHVRKSGYGE
ncbi:hypothetical protein FISHEDRAFT_62345 [Fistulina hepatica ATCC 64428]|nr:hypothetical protein FISHEDRAFT_62345 [Fistulina hepatica ATCC 64428]